MKTALITGADGFMGKNLRVGIGRIPGARVIPFVRSDSEARLAESLAQADVVYHLAGVNRPKDVTEFVDVNAGLTRILARASAALDRKPLIVFASSIQAELDNPYGSSKKQAEEILAEYAGKHGGRVAVYRLPNVFGKWCRPNYNSVVATFCYNIIHGLDIHVSDPKREIELVYIDDVVAEFAGHLDGLDAFQGVRFLDVPRAFRVTLGNLADRLRELNGMRESLVVPNLEDDFMKCLHATFLSYLDRDSFASPLDVKTDNRGQLAELIKSRQFGQVFVSSTRPGVVRGNHYHDSKVEKFCVLKGEAVIRFRHVLNGEVLSYPVSGDSFQVVDIPPGYTHSIENTGGDEMIVLFWANQVFDPDKPDTYSLDV